jgi:hypothetical protein
VLRILLNGAPRVNPWFSAKADKTFFFHESAWIAIFRGVSSRYDVAVDRGYEECDT